MFYILSMVIFALIVPKLGIFPLFNEKLDFYSYVNSQKSAIHNKYTLSTLSRSLFAGLVCAVYRLIRLFGTNYTAVILSF